MPAKCPCSGVQRCAGAVFVSTLWLAGACSPFHAHRAIPAPAGAIAAAALSGERVAVLAGTDEAKGIFIIDLTQGTLLKNFGVTREATGIAAESDNGPILVSVGGVAHGRGFGAVERWGLDGVKQRVVPMPAQARGITREVDGSSYVLLAGNLNVRAALPLDIPSLRAGAAIPLVAGARTLQQCKIGALDYLVYTDGDRGVVMVRAVASGRTLSSAVVADSPECGDDGRIYAISKSFSARSLAVLALPSLEQVGSIPISNLATTLYQRGNHEIMSLDATAQRASFEMLPQKSDAGTRSE
jgi:hypothetical protein